MSTVRCTLLGLSLMILSGCSVPKKTSTPARQEKPSLAVSESPTALISNTDPCAMRLHDISGAFMLYIAVHKDLPPALSDLKKLSDEELIFVCPESNQPYVYSASGILLPDMKSRIVLYDPAPSHKNYRQAIAIAEPQSGQSLVAKVVALPESFFLLHPPQKVAEPKKN